MKLFSLIVVCGLASIACSTPSGTASKEMDLSSDKLYDALIARIDQLEAKSESRDWMYETKIAKLLEEHRRHTDQLRYEYQTQIDKLRHDYESEVDSLRHDMIKQKSRINKLEVTVHRQEQENYKLYAKDDIATSNEQLSSQGETTNKQTISNNSVGTDNSESKELNESEHRDVFSPAPRQRSVHPGSLTRRLEPEMEVAFYATLLVTQHNLGHNQDVAFDHVIINQGNGYNPHGGIFIAPVSGTYVLSVSLTTLTSHSTHYGLFKNSDRITVLYVNGAMNTYDSSSQTSILHLDKGDDVTVKHTDTDHDLTGNHHSMFSGFLLYQDFTDTTPAVVG